MFSSSFNLHNPDCFQRYRHYYYSFLFPSDEVDAFVVPVPLDRGLNTYLSIDDLCTTLYLSGAPLTHHVQNMDDWRVLITHDPLNHSLLPYAYAFYHVPQTDPNIPRTLSLVLTPASNIVWRGDILVVRLNTDNGSLPVRRGRPCQMDERDKATVTDILVRCVSSNPFTHPSLILPSVLTAGALISS